MFLLVVQLRPWFQLPRKSPSVWCRTILSSVNYVLNKRWFASSPTRSIGGTTREEVEVGQWKQENSGKEEAYSSPVLPRHRRKMWPAPLKKVPSHVAYICWNNGLIQVTRVNKKPELMGQALFSWIQFLCDYFGAKLSGQPRWQAGSHVTEWC